MSHLFGLSPAITRFLFSPGRRSSISSLQSSFATDTRLLSILIYCRCPNQSPLSSRIHIFRRSARFRVQTAGQGIRVFPALHVVLIDLLQQNFWADEKQTISPYPTSSRVFRQVTLGCARGVICPAHFRPRDNNPIA